jgi:hypothetical protein
MCSVPAIAAWRHHQAPFLIPRAHKKTDAEDRLAASFRIGLLFNEPSGGCQFAL